MTDALSPSISFTEDIPMSTCADQLGAINDRYLKLKAEFLKNDGKIDAAEKKRLDALGDEWDRARNACLQRAQDNVDKAATAAGTRFKIDATKFKAFKDHFKKLDIQVQEAASDVLNVLLTDPPPKDSRAKIRESLRLLSDGARMNVGKELNKLGIYLPNLQEESPGAEDASARIKKMHVSGDFILKDASGAPIGPDEVQIDYVKGLVLQAKKQGFKLVVQITKGEITVDEVVTRLAAETAIAKPDLPKYMEVLEAKIADYVWSEDNKWLSVDGTKVHTSPDISSATDARVQRFTQHNLSTGPDIREGHHSAGLDGTDTPDDARPRGMIEETNQQRAVDWHEFGKPATVGVPRAKPHLSADALGKATGKTVVPNRTYCEGGNMLVGTRPDGQPYAMIGRDGLLLSTFHLEEEYANETNPAKKKAHEFSPDNVKARRDSMTFNPSEVAATMERLQDIYSHPPLEPTKVDDSDPTASPDDKTAYKEMKAAFDKEKKQFDDEKAEFNKDKEEFTKRFLAKIDITKDIFAKDTHIARKDLIFIPQPDFHVDMHIRPLAPGQVMVDDFDKDIELLDNALKLATKGSWEEKQLLTMKENVRRTQKAMGPVIKEIERQLKDDAGLDVKPMPGVMEADMEPFTADPAAPPDSIQKEVAMFLGLAAPKAFTRKELGHAFQVRLAGRASPDIVNRAVDQKLNDIFTRHANFMNAVPGTKDGTNQSFYMTNATSIQPLQKAYEAYLKKEVGVENVEWIGGTGGGGEFKRTASELSLSQQGGLDCRENH
jgi:hypothetical protein